MLRTFKTESDFEAGRRVGLFLLAAGHRRICCLLDHAAIPWQAARFEGIRAACAEAGFPDAVLAVSAFTGPEASLPTDDDASTRSLLNAVSDIAQRRRVGCRQDKLHDFGRAFSWFLQREQAYARLEPHMCDLLSNTTITAWVGMNDEIAAECLHFLRGARVPVPRRISVLGFDDSFRAASLSMSSYCFNGASAMHRMVEYILRPREMRDVEPVVTEGFLHERGTTGRAAIAGRA
jgi:DNA-binding LacI/PurR family transcriptional regulator